MEKKVTIGGHLNGSINFAMQQNYVPIIRSLVIHNETEAKLNDLHLKITFEPDFARAFSYDIQSIEAGESVEISPVRIRLSTEFLFSLTEKMVGNIFVDLYEGDTKIYGYEDTIELLAYDQWSGLFVMPEMIAAFVTPNHPRIAEVLTKASKYLEQWTGTPAFTGYQTQNPDNVKKQMAAIYAALQSAEIVYNNPPASYEMLGQRVRLPHVVLEQKQGTCLDLAVLYAACLEAAGLHPLIVFTKGHAYGGCWLEMETFADCAEDDISALEKRVVDGSEEILLLECTDVTAGKQIDFERALKHGKDHLLQISDFACVIDVQRTRGSGIRPIPVRLEQVRLLENQDSGEIQFNGDVASEPKELNLKPMIDLSGVEENITKQKVWERKLLDFSLRNALLNFRVNKNSLQLMVADLGELEDKLSDGKDFHIMEIPSEWTVSLRDVKMYEIENERDLIQNIATEEAKSNRLRTFLPEDELTKHLKNIYRAAKVSIEENGTNTLFLALGFLRWFESDLSEKPRYAPIVLIPIDIVKSSRNKGYVIRSRQEEAQVNITLLEYLRQIYGLKITGLDPLPADEHGIDLPLVYHTIRQAIMGKNRWNIENMAFIGLFSFGQFVMWNDIRNRSKELEENKVVSSLIEGKMNWSPEEQTVTLDNLDQVIEPDKMAVPMSADSSQMVAIAAAAGGQSFVLHGPPGTGKSQTITNMIANALYQGKSVLFVAEKMAALNVVQSRLASIGLDPFCLELHSNKTNKSNVLQQLNKALEVGRIKAPEDYKATADKIHELRKSLNAVVEALHSKRTYGGTLYEAIEKYEANKSHKGKIMFPNEIVEAASEENIGEWDEALRQYTVAIADVDSYENSPLKGYEGTEYSIGFRDELEQLLNELIMLHPKTKACVERLCQWSGVGDDKAKKTLDEFVRLGSLISNSAPTLSLLIESPNFAGISEQIKSMCQDGSSYNHLYGELANIFEVQVFAYDVNDAVLRLKQAEISWFLPKMMGKNKLVKELKLYAKNPAAITKNNLAEYYEKLSEMQMLKNRILGTTTAITDYMSGLYLGTKTDWTMVLRALEKAYGIQEFFKDVEKTKHRLYLEAIADYSNDKEIMDAVEGVESFIGRVLQLTETYQINLASVYDSKDWAEAVVTIMRTYKDNLFGLKNWVTMQQKAKQMKGVGLSSVVEAWEKGHVHAANIRNAYEGNLYYTLILKTIGEDDRLKDFQGRQYEDMISQYGELIEKFRVLTIQELVAKLSAQIPVSGTASAASSEIGILKRAIKSNGRMLSIRKLFNDITTLLRKLCPCMLMSPISVAQYIDPAFPKFDLVIFDEASQLPTSEAVGTIARGENVVIVGDPKQLPPTSFFSSNRVDEENMDKEDLESLLDDCLSISMPQEHLKWHYRSRHESLIAYSNMKYYDNKLYTFPSPNDLVSEVKLVHVDGFYDKGKTKQNKAEAKAVVDEIARRLSDESLRNDSIGVVTFSSVQQNLIDDMLADVFVKHPELEELDKNAKEPIFIKNLENVQGDERDVILFSIGYGPDKEGKVSMNFGPLNRDGGWRRLNVAISRARKHMVVYSTLRPEQIDLSRTRAEGLVGLRGFLEFAERGKNVLACKVGAISKPKDTLVLQVAEEIRKMGYEVKCNIGCSEYKMDIGVIDAAKPDTYLLGILLDGENCREAATSRDRFILQPNVLKGLGWKIMRVWALEWLDNPEKVLQGIKAELENSALTREVASIQIEIVPKAEVAFEKMDISEVERYQSASAQYKSFEIHHMGYSETFYEPSAQTAIAKVMRSILIQEAPISRKALMRKVLSAWGISRSGSRVEASFDMALRKVQKKETRDMNNVFYWKIDQVPEEYTGYRVEDQNGNKRSMDEVSSYEITNAIKEVLAEQVGLSRIDLIRETARKFGFTRLGSVIETAISNAIDCAIERGIVVVLEGDKVTLV